MKYLGGKHGIGKELSQFLYENCPPECVDGYLEPFCGSLGVFKYMTTLGYKKCEASDIQKDLIEMWKQIQKGTLKIPNNISEAKYNKLKQEKSPNAMKAVAGFGLSFGGKFFAGYSQKWSGSSGRDFLKEFKNSIEKITPNIQQKNVKFSNKSYLEFKPKNMLIYCDPPYKETQSYTTGSFDHELFWKTIKEWSKNNYVFISEESAPKGFKTIWKKAKQRSLDKANRFFKYERLYVINKHKKCTIKNKINKNNKTRKK